MPIAPALYRLPPSHWVGAPFWYNTRQLTAYPSASEILARTTPPSSKLCSSHSGVGGGGGTVATGVGVAIGGVSVGVVIGVSVGVTGTADTSQFNAKVNGLALVSLVRKEMLPV